MQNIRDPFSDNDGFVNDDEWVNLNPYQSDDPFVDDAPLDDDCCFYESEPDFAAPQDFAGAPDDFGDDAGRLFGAGDAPIGDRSAGFFGECRVSASEPAPAPAAGAGTAVNRAAKGQALNTELPPRSYFGRQSRSQGFLRKGNRGLGSSQAAGVHYRSSVLPAAAKQARAPSSEAGAQKHGLPRIRKAGRIVSFVQELGFGYIRSEGHEVRFQAADFLDAEEPALLYDGAQVSFDIEPSGRGYNAKRLQLVRPAGCGQLRYSPPPEFMLFKFGSKKPWQLLSEVKGCVVRAEDLNPERAKNNAIELAKSIGANALTQVRQSVIRLETKLVNGRTQYSSLHQFEGVPCFVARRNFAGELAPEQIPSQLQQKADRLAVEKRDFEARRGAEVKRWRLFILLQLALSLPFIITCALHPQLMQTHFVLAVVSAVIFCTGIFEFVWLMGKNTRAEKLSAQGFFRTYTTAELDEDEDKEQSRKRA